LANLKKYIRDNRKLVDTKNKLEYFSIRSRSSSEQIVYLDASSSGSQLMAIMTNNISLAKITNTYKDKNFAYDPYTKIVENTKVKYPRSLLKEYIITSAYNVSKRSLILKIQNELNSTYKDAYTT